MAITVAWPLPATIVPIRNDFSETPGDTSIETKMDSGLSKKRMRYTKGIDVITIGYILSAAEYITLRTFFVTTTASGTLPFLWTHPLTGLSISVRIKSGSFKMTPAGVDYHVQFTVDVLV